MKDKLRRYWDARLIAMGDYERSGRSFSCTNWHRLINGTPPNRSEESAPRDMSEQAETAFFVSLLLPDEQALARAAYTRDSKISRQFAGVFLERCAIKLERLRTQRLNGESLDPERRRTRPRIARIKIDRRTVAATQTE